MLNLQENQENGNHASLCPIWLQRLLLALFLMHFLGVLSEPLRFFSRSDVRTAPEFLGLSEIMRPYSQWLYMNHGYFFFAPNPGPGHLIQCSVQPTTTPGSLETAAPKTFTLPDRKEHWPRLLYHRYFMLSEFYTSRYAPEQITDDLKKDLEFMPRWAYDKELYDQIRVSITESLEHSRGIERVELRRIERLLPDSQQVLKDGWSLDDPRLVEILPESMIEPPAEAPIHELPRQGGERVSQ